MTLILLTIPRRLQNKPSILARFLSLFNPCLFHAFVGIFRVWRAPLRFQPLPVIFAAEESACEKMLLVPCLHRSPIARGLDDPSPLCPKFKFILP